MFLGLGMWLMLCLLHVSRAVISYRSGGSSPDVGHLPGGVTPASWCPFSLQIYIRNSQNLGQCCDITILSWQHSSLGNFSRAESHPLFSVGFYHSISQKRQAYKPQNGDCADWHWLHWPCGCCTLHSRTSPRTPPS